MNNKCIAYLEAEKNDLLIEFPKYENATEKVYEILLEFISDDFNGISENKVFRYYLSTIKEIVSVCFEFKCSKVYMRSLFKRLKSKPYMDFVVNLMPSQNNDIKFISERLISEFVYWQNSDNTKDEKEKEVMDYLNSCE